jgi:hypothetical protein
VHTGLAPESSRSCAEGRPARHWTRVQKESFERHRLLLVDGIVAPCARAELARALTSGYETGNIEATFVGRAGGARLSAWSCATVVRGFRGKTSDVKIEAAAQHCQESLEISRKRIYDKLGYEPRHMGPLYQRGRKRIFRYGS